MTGPSALSAPNLPPDLLWRETGDNTGGSDGPFDDPSPFLVFGGMALVNLAQSFPTDGANCKCQNRLGLTSVDVEFFENDRLPET